MMETNIRTIVRLVKAGDQSGFEELYRLLNSGLRLLIARSLGLQDVDDHVHETLLIVIGAIQNGQLHDPKRFLSDVCAVARKLIAETVEGRVRQRDDRVAPATVKPVNGFGAPEDQALDQQQIAIMQRILTASSRRDCEILARYYVRGQAQEQILADMNITALEFQSCKSKARARFARLGEQMRVPTRSLDGIRLRLAHAHP